MTNALRPGSHQYIIPSFHTTSQLLLDAGPLMLNVRQDGERALDALREIQLGAAEEPLGIVG